MSDVTSAHSDRWHFVVRYCTAGFWVQKVQRPGAWAHSTGIEPKVP